MFVHVAVNTGKHWSVPLSLLTNPHPPPSPIQPADSVHD